MTKKIITLIIMCLLALSAFSAKYVSDDGSIGVDATSLSISKTVIKASGNVILVSKTDGNNVRVTCDSIKVVPFDAKNLSKGLASAKEAIFTGNINFKFSVNGDNKISYLGTADSAYYDGTTQLLTMKGNVKIEYQDKSIDNPNNMTATGEKAVLNLKEVPADEDVIFSIEGENKRAKIDIDPQMFEDNL